MWLPGSSSHNRTLKAAGGNNAWQQYEWLSSWLHLLCVSTRTFFFIFMQTFDAYYQFSPLFTTVCSLSFFLKRRFSLSLSLAWLIFRLPLTFIFCDLCHSPGKWILVNLSSASLKVIFASVVFLVGRRILELFTAIYLEPFLSLLARLSGWTYSWPSRA